MKLKMTRSGYRLSRLPCNGKLEKLAGTHSWSDCASIDVAGSWWAVVGSAGLMQWQPACPLQSMSRSFTSVQMFHTHTPLSGVKNWGPDCEVKMRMTGRWRWDEDEDGMKLLNRNTRRGTPKRRGGTKREHQHQHTLPGAGEPWKGKGKEKAEADGRTPRQAEGGEGRTRLNQPNPSENKTYLSTHGTKPTWRRGARMK